MKGKIPSTRELLLVYALISFMFSAWTIITFMWKLPSWILYLKGEEILVIFFYAMSSNFLEGLIVMSINILFAVIVPFYSFRDAFVARAGWFSISIIGSMMMVLWLGPEFAGRFYERTYLYLAEMVVLTFFIVYFGGRIRVMRLSVEWIADRLMVFLYLFVPLYLVSIIAIIVRNIS